MYASDESGCNGDVNHYTKIEHAQFVYNIYIYTFSSYWEKWLQVWHGGQTHMSTLVQVEGEGPILLGS